MYWRVRFRSEFFNVAEKPTEKTDGTLVLANGRAFAKGTWQLTEVPGNLPRMARGAVGTISGKPERQNNAGGFGSDNTRRR